MKEYPLICTAWEVQAILERCKTQARRPLDSEWQNLPGPNGYESGSDTLSCFRGVVDGLAVWDMQATVDSTYPLRIRSPFGVPGDRLWVREVWGLIGVSPIYKATAPATLRPYPSWLSPITMPRRYSRLTLERISNRPPELLQKITWQDALAEGLEYEVCCSGHECACRGLPVDNPVHDFEMLWDSRYAKRGDGWDKNPWCFVVDFRRVDV